MLIRGEKWACEACIRGHRVSNCQHADRKLVHINKKGRPVSQCPHCRGLRKSRTTHTKCECAEKAHTKAECQVKESGDNQAGKKLCCCTHGLRCTCAAKRDSNLGTVPELGPPRSRAASHLGHRRPHGASMKSEEAIHGCSPRNKTRIGDASKRGLPYAIPRSNTVHLPTGSARRSADHLPLLQAGIGQDGAQGQDSITSAPRPVRQVRSEHGSPCNTPLLGLDESGFGLPPLDISLPPYDMTNPPSNFFDSFYSPETEAFPETPSYVPPVDWSSLGLAYNPGNAPASFSQPPSYASFDNNNFNQSNLALSSSGELSEVEDYTFGLGLSNFEKPETHSNSDGSDAGMHPLNSPSYVGYPQTQMIPTSEPYSLDVDALFKAGISQPPQPFDIAPATALDNYAVPQDYPPAGRQNFTTVGDASLLLGQGDFVTAEPNNFMWDPTPYPMAAPVPDGNMPPQQQAAQWY